MRVCFERIAEDWHTLRSEEDEQILQKYTEYGKRLATVYLVYICVTGVAFLLQPLIILFIEDNNASNVTVYKLPVRLDYGSYIEKYYYLFVVHSYISILAHMAVWTTVDILLVVFVQHVCGLFSIVGHSLERVGRNVGVNYQLYLVKSEDNEYSEIFHSFRGHIRAMEFAQEIESLFSMTFFFVGGLSMIAISATGIQAVINSDSIYDILRYAPLCSSQLFQLFYHCWQAQQLLDHSTNVYESISNGSWYQTSARSRKLLCLMLTRRNRPCQLTAGKLYVLSIEAFCTIVRTSMSYFTLLRSAQTEFAD
ncbi:hypothetical protein KPH14_005366 [Odynerus spinipes]|uniref:Odorant receptor n=1 Tax=Odynerus spinipes TaxID=1348599 RepID=A0AAD9VJA8_9HYME|nr:hypothetical protein KPH14_005366 [Odynerus spinipes]